MSGPVTTTDVPAAPEPGAAEPSGVEVLDDRVAEVGGLPVRRALPKRARRTVGPWCFLDHFGPASLDEASMQVGPHPHIGLATVTWVVEGEVLHRDSLGTEQLVRPGQLNLMSAGRGVAHAEESPAGAAGSLHGVQLWVAQPEATRTAAPAFEHHAALPVAEPAPGTFATVVVGELAGERSPARADHPALAADLVLSGQADLPLAPAFEHALVVLDGAVRVEGVLLAPGRLAHLGPGRSDLQLAAAGDPARALLVGGTPFPFPLVMWWNFVGRTRDEVAAAREDWVAGSDRFGAVGSPLGRIAPPGLPWSSTGMDRRGG